VFEAGDQGGTYNGNPLMTAVGYSVISQLLRPASSKACGPRRIPEAQAARAVGGARLEGERGEGMLRALLLGDDIGPQIVEKARDMQPDGLLLNAARPNLLRFMPALNVTTKKSTR
jgi:acetylornithine/N-succinyldiaminopimelate aminotransferase